MTTTSVLIAGVANAVGDETIAAGMVAAAASANQRTVFMVGHVVTPLVIPRQIERNVARIQELPSRDERR